MYYLNQIDVQKKLMKHWYALYTRPKFERKIETELKMKGLSPYLPLHTVQRVWSDRIKKIQAPLFPSYIFIHANLSERYRAVQTNGVIRVVSFNGEPVQVPSEQIEGIKKVLENGFNPEPYQYFAFGDEVEVVCGPLKGLRGLFIEERGKERLAISIHPIQQSFAIEIARPNVKKVKKTGLTI